MTDDSWNNPEATNVQNSFSFTPQSLFTSGPSHRSMTSYIEVGGSSFVESKHFSPISSFPGGLRKVEILEKNSARSGVTPSKRYHCYGIFNLSIKKNIVKELSLFSSPLTAAKIGRLSLKKYISNCKEIFKVLFLPNFSGITMVGHPPPPP